MRSVCGFSCSRPSCRLEREIGSAGITRGSFRCRPKTVLAHSTRWHPRFMPDRDSYILCINGGSSSIKYASFELARPAGRVLSGSIERVGVKGGVTFRTATGKLLEQVAQHIDLRSLAAVAHRVVHGGPRFQTHRRIDDEVLAELRQLQSFDPQHLPGEIALIEEFRVRVSDVPHFACFDTAFHAGLPRVARLLPIPRRLETRGVR